MIPQLHQKGQCDNLITGLERGRVSGLNQPVSGSNSAFHSTPSCGIIP